ncbi:MAG: hypothetical protein IPM61_03415 [Chlorobi bacterium]|nr:MAG: hypothetical protein UZ07_CHB004000846 [Chlorobi bacterium OLB7]MBK8910354.1 hypothetical protein [Chlorobiota bacterium]MBX7217242.1 hypothetical protein [Candidatus Kapabacteria bacterium]MCE7933139.1 hypothetical protein [Chlorobi bacterium CHB2]
MNNELHAGKTYTIRVREKLDRQWEEWFNGMTLSTDSEGTLLTGFLPDQSALHGVIATIHRLGLRLVAVIPQDEKDQAAEQN